jgi:hypothetical protein
MPWSNTWEAGHEELKQAHDDYVSKSQSYDPSDPGEHQVMLDSATALRDALDNVDDIADGDFAGYKSDINEAIRRFTDLVNGVKHAGPF